MFWFSYFARRITIKVQLFGQSINDFSNASQKKEPKILLITAIDLPLIKELTQVFDSRKLPEISNNLLQKVQFGHVFRSISLKRATIRLK